MFEHFAFTLKADSDTTSDDDDPPPSPKSKPSDRSSPTMATMAMPPAAVYNSDGDRIESLVRKMSKQTLLRELQPPPSFESQNCETDFNLQSNQAPIQIQIQDSSDITGTSMELDINQHTQPVIDNHTIQSRLQRHYEILGNHLEHPVTDEDSSLRIPAGDRPRRQSETRLNSNPPGSRTIDLMSNMIENGVQCNVHISRPTSPLPAPRQPSPAPHLVPSNNPDLNINPQIFANSNVELEVDMDFLKQGSDESPLNDSLALREAGAPMGIRKFGYLRYRSSYEAAARCKNMRKSVPRMRRRPKPSPSDSTTSSSVTGSTTGILSMSSSSRGDDVYEYDDQKDSSGNLAIAPWLRNSIDAAFCDHRDSPRTMLEI
ncbi:hypothetical protein M434DRAFT_37084 [Hypoxylon sp. CO27-5]|nr:hypothetical protein M434DRAFT_37084 [Hypoxylon sp. CO27-5]